MFPNPQDVFPLPRQPDFEPYKKRAKELVRTGKSTDPDALRNWSTNWVTVNSRSAEEKARVTDVFRRYGATP
jgi:hypothetical protein